MTPLAPGISVFGRRDYIRMSIILDTINYTSGITMNSLLILDFASQQVSRRSH